ncbi:SEC-C metal-binding domain-containing protein [Desulfobulbus alkaliphilus]|uniref:SEC-C metal-binding domain-containing protein n=1 Tax=Desulfobulbus alkaliphilus TaxID=869814 RepID=UPI00196469FD|nr:SEC-C metal-binding domain-containing protein [Desulfobulbus alkaliphilus]MBM9536982.1 SEC-C domain-containing protein [Desulfobulbus alkaliphilus]
MAKIGRNQPCPCGSGKKHKHCCLYAAGLQQPVADQAKGLKISLLAEIEKIQQAASVKKELFHELGVFLFFSTTKGDAWLLEMTDSDALQVARESEALEVDIDENSETIELTYSHTFTVADRRLLLTSYTDKSEMHLDDAPGLRIRNAMRRIRKRYPAAMLDRVHVPG